MTQTDSTHFSAEEQVAALRRSALNSVALAEDGLAEFKRFCAAAPEREWLVAYLERSQVCIAAAIESLRRAREAANQIATT